MIRVQGPDGATITFPDGTAPDAINAAMAERHRRTDSPSSPVETYDAAVAALKARARPAYEAAYAGEFAATPALEGLLRRPAMREALSRARTLAEDQGISLPKDLDLRTLDFARAALDHAIADSRLPGRLRGRAAYRTPFLQGMKAALLEELGKASPAYRNARAIDADDASLRKAYEAGEGLLTANMGALGNSLLRMGEGEKEVFRLGAANAIRNDAARGANSADRVFVNKALRSRLRLAFPNGEAYAEFEDRMRRDEATKRTSSANEAGSLRTDKPAEPVQSPAADPTAPRLDASASRRTGMKRDARYYLGPHASEALDRLRALAEMFTPVVGAPESSADAMQALKEGRYLDALFDTGLSAAAIAPGGKAPARAAKAATLHAVHEALPGSSTRHMEKLQKSDRASKDEYAADSRSTDAIRTGDDGKMHDALYGAAEHPTRPAIEAQGVWKGRHGLELNRAENARPLVSLDTAPDGTRSLSAKDRAAAETVETLRAAINAQDASAAHVNMPSRDGAMGSVWLPLKRALTPEEAVLLRGLGQRYGLGDVVDTGEGATLTNFAGTDARRSAEALRGGLPKELASVVPDAGRPDRLATDSVYQPLSDQWTMPDRQDHVTRRLLDALDATPSVRDALDRSPLVPQLARNKHSRDEELAARSGDIPRETIQTMRQIIGQGPGWVNRLREAIGKGILPAAVVPILLPLVLEEQEKASGRVGRDTRQSAGD